MHGDRTFGKADWQFKNEYEQLVAAELAWVAVLGPRMGTDPSFALWSCPKFEGQTAPRKPFFSLILVEHFYP